MKKLFCALFCLLMIGTMSIAMAEKPGDTVTIYLSITEVNGDGAAHVHFDASSAPVTCTGAVATGAGGNWVVAPPTGNVGKFGIIKAEGVATGSVGTVTFRINDNAKPGRYTIKVWGSLAATGVSGSKSFTIEGCAEHTSDAGTVTKAATCTEEGTKTFKCTACNEVLKTEKLPMLAHNMDDVKTTEAPTCTKDGTKTYACTMCKAVQKTEAIPATGHSEGETKVTKAPTCTEKGEKTTYCVDCKAVIKTAEIDAKGHTEGETKVTKAPTCTEKGEKTTYCSACAAVLKTEAVDAKGHQKGKGTVSKEPTCTETGLQSYKCTVCDAEIENEVIPAKGHEKGKATVSKQPTCTETGLQSYKCTVCGAEIENETIPAKGHKEDKGTVTKEAACAEKGVKTFKCTVCGEVLREQEIAAKGHKEDKGTITVAPTCTEKGKKVIKCSVCGEELRTENVAAKGHKAGKWVVTKPATDEEDGERELHCAVCDVVIRTETISNKVYYHMSVCSLGLRFRDIDENLTDDWFMFTPIDLSVDGEYTFDLIAGNIHQIGTVTVTVAQGAVTVTCELSNPRYINVVEEFFTILPDLASVETVDPEELTGFVFGEPISIQEDLGGDTNVLLFICNRVRYQEGIAGVHAFDRDGKEYEALAEELKLLLD